jgi:hypothetical protein
MQFIHTFTSRVAGIPCQIGVTDYDKYVPAQTYGPPDGCYPAEGGVGNWIVLDSHGKPAEWLARKVTLEDARRIDRELFEEMEVCL